MHPQGTVSVWMPNSANAVPPNSFPSVAGVVANDTASEMCEHFLKAQSPMEETDSPMISFPSSPSHWKKALSPIWVTEFGITKSPVKSKQKAKALSPMETTESGISIEVIPVMPLNALSPMAVTVLGITVFLHPAVSSLVLVSMMALQSFLES